jgi:hypothetical protein
MVVVRSLNALLTECKEMLGPREKIAALTLRLLVVFIGGLLLVLLLVPLLGPGWHLLHGDSISAGGWKIPVPKRFYATETSEGPVMWKYAFGIPFFKAPYGHIKIYGLSSVHPARQPFAYDRDYSRFERGVTQEAIQSGYRLERKSATQVGANSGYCLEFTRSTGLTHPVLGRSQLRCAIENSTAVLFYEGDPRYIPDVFTTLQGMSPQSHAPSNL